LARRLSGTAKACGCSSNGGKVGANHWCDIHDVTQMDGSCLTPQGLAGGKVAQPMTSHQSETDQSKSGLSILRIGTEGRVESRNGAGCPGLVGRDAGLRVRVECLIWHTAVYCAIVIRVLSLEAVGVVCVMSRRRLGVGAWRARRTLTPRKDAISKNTDKSPGTAQMRSRGP
jgi:hypothetical protein